MTPDFAELLLNTPMDKRTDLVFKLVGRFTGQQMTSARTGRVILVIGKIADVIVNLTDKKYASARDLRRTFGTRWTARVKPATLPLPMRHRSFKTTMKYSVCQDSDDIADKLWSSYEAVRCDAITAEGREE